MLDQWTYPFFQKLYIKVLYLINQLKIKPNQLTLLAFFFGIIASYCVSIGSFIIAIIFLSLNRIFDGLDGALAKYTNTSTDRGAFLDIILDLLFYSMFIFSFSIYNFDYSQVTSFILFSFVGTSSSFLAHSIFIKSKKNILTVHQHKGILYSENLIEGTETAIFFYLMCLFPTLFTSIGIVFGILCCITTISRIINIYKQLR